jgi:hypothetical protein
MRAMYPCLSLVAILTLLLFASESAVAVPNCSQVDTGFCLNPDPVNCTVSLEWRGAAGTAIDSGAVYGVVRNAKMLATAGGSIVPAMALAVIVSWRER